MRETKLLGPRSWDCFSMTTLWFSYISGGFNTKLWCFRHRSFWLTRDSATDFDYGSRMSVKSVGLCFMEIESKSKAIPYLYISFKVSNLCLFQSRCFQKVKHNTHELRKSWRDIWETIRSLSKRPARNSSCCFFFPPISWPYFFFLDWHWIPG